MIRKLDHANSLVKQVCDDKTKRSVHHEKSLEDISPRKFLDSFMRVTADHRCLICWKSLSLTFSWNILRSQEAIENFLKIEDFGGW